MEVIKRKILLEDSIDRSYNSKTWGVLTADTFYINVFLTQNIDDMGLFTDIQYLSADTNNPTSVDYTILIDKLSSSGLTFPFMTLQTPYLSGYTNQNEETTLRLPQNNVSDYYNSLGIKVTGATDSKIDDVKSYDANERYKVAFDMDAETYINYNNIEINGVSRVVSKSEPTVYVFDTLNNNDIGTLNQQFGLLYSDYSGTNRTIVINGIPNTIPLTTFSFIGEGQNETNTSLSALTKEEYLFGIISPPEVKNDVFIERGIVSVLEPHLKLSEIKNLGQLSRYGNGYYNLTKQ
jgi:hypothetical protein